MDGGDLPAGVLRGLRGGGPGHRPGGRVEVVADHPVPARGERPQQRAPMSPMPITATFTPITVRRAGAPGREPACRGVFPGESTTPPDRPLG